MGSFIFNLGFYLYKAYYFLIILHILMSWLPNLKYTTIGRWVEKLVDPYLSFFRRLIPPIGMFDLSSIVALIVFRIVGALALEGLKELVIQ
ncbi:YggT family protein [[Brevibacterium] frigoritolerans]|nr:YggT family protein [Peribacillus frigoritolerans]